MLFDINILNDDITIYELEFAISKLKLNKSCGMDGILNEFIKRSTPSVKNVMLKLFNVILESGIFPQ